VGQRQDHELLVRAVGRDHVLDRPGLVDEVAVGQHDALGHAGGAGGVDEGEGLARGRARRRAPPGADRSWASARLALGLQAIEAEVVDAVGSSSTITRTSAQAPRRAGAGPAVGPPTIARVATATIADEVRGLLGRGRRVDRHADRPHEGDRQVADGPLDPGRRHQGDPGSRAPPRARRPARRPRPRRCAASRARSGCARSRGA
jgi:hypothetical protein